MNGGISISAVHREHIYRAVWGSSGCGILLGARSRTCRLAAVRGQPCDFAAGPWEPCLPESMSSPGTRKSSDGWGWQSRQDSSKSSEMGRRCPRLRACGGWGRRGVRRAGSKPGAVVLRAERSSPGRRQTLAMLLGVGDDDKYDNLYKI